jgi:hypothetical protein
MPEGGSCQLKSPRPLMARHKFPISRTFPLLAARQTDETLSSRLGANFPRPPPETSHLITLRRGKSFN